MEVLEGEGVVFQVEVTGSPQPKMTWYHDGQEVKSDYSMELGDDGSLTMPSAETKHSGVYQLVAQNPAGRVEKKVTLTVQVQKEVQSMDGAAVVTQPPSTTALPVSMFGSHVEKCHLGQNQPFKDQYKVRIVYIHPLHMRGCHSVCVYIRSYIVVMRSQQPLLSIQKTKQRIVFSTSVSVSEIPLNTRGCV